MSEDRTSKNENAPANSDVLLKPEKADDVLVDRTQQLIDEVNQLLGTSDLSPENASETKAATPLPPASAAKIEEDLSASAATLKSFLDSLGGGDSTESPESVVVDSAEPEAEVYEPTVEEPQIEVDDGESSFDLESLKKVFGDDTEEEETVENVETESDAVAVDDIDVESELADQPTVDANDIEEAPVVEAPEVDAAEAESQEEPAVAKDITQKYLDELRSSFGQEPEATEDAEGTDDGVNADAKDERDATAVEGESSPNVGDVANQEELVDEEAIERDSAEAPPNAESENATSNFMPTIVFDNDEASVESESFEGGDLAKLQASFEASLKKLESRIGGMFSTLSAQIDQVSQLAQTGIVSPHVQSDVTIESEGGTQSDSNVPKPESAEASQPQVDGDKIEVLKEQLKSKLREAEIELSINRAKLSQQRAAMEQMQADLERRESAVEAKLEQAKKTAASGEKKGSIMDRWKRHLGE